jgi:hypothetical protein
MQFLDDSTTLVNSNEEINRQSSSLFSSGSPFCDNLQSSFDLASEHQNTDLEDLNDFFSKQESKFSQIERPQNPFHKNFESYKTETKKQTLSHSLSDATSTELMPFIEKAMRKTASVQALAVFGSPRAEAGSSAAESM